MFSASRVAGIVKGIDFDEVINDKELSRLESWLNQNRSSAITAKERFLVGLVDEVLADRVITADEKMQLLAACEEFGKTEGASPLFELEGIVDGILCDGEINEKEIRSLGQWVKNNPGLKGNDIYDFITRELSSILADGLITRAEKLEFFESLSAKMKAYRFERKLSALRSKVRKNELIGLDLIEMIDQEEAIEKIHRLAETQLKAALESITGYVHDKEIIFISAVLIGLLEYDSAFYNGVENTYSILYRYYSKPKIEGIIRDTLSRYQTQWDDDYEGRIINIALRNSIVPRHYLPSFFEFVFDIYKLNLEYALSDEVESEFRFAFDGLREKMLGGGDNLSVEVTKKSYKLIRTTKDVVLNEDTVDDIVRLSCMIARIIDDHIWVQNVSLFNPYLRYGYERWAKTLAKDDVAQRGTRSHSESRSRWEPQFELDGSNVVIKAPQHRIKGSYDYWDLRVSVFNGDEILCEDCETDIRYIIGGYKVAVKPIVVDRPIGQIRYRITAGEDTIFDSGSRLYRDILVFDLRGREVKNNKDFEGTCIVCYDSEGSLAPYVTNDWYKLAVHQAQVGDSLVVGDAIHNFSAVTKPGLRGEKWDACVVEGPNGVQIPSYKQLFYLAFEEPSDRKNFEIALAGKRYRLSDFTYKVVERPGYKKYIIDMGSVSPGVYNLEVFELVGASKRKLLTETFAYDPDFSAAMVEPEGADEDGCCVELCVESSLFDRSVRETIDKRAFDEKWLRFECRGVSYVYKIACELGIYRIDGGLWKPYSDEIWTADLNDQSKIELYGTRYSDAVVVSPQNAILGEPIEPATRNLCQVMPVGHLLAFKPDNDFTLLRLRESGKTKEKIVFRNRCCLERKDIDFLFDPVSGILTLRWSYLGRGKVNLLVTESDGRFFFRADGLKNDDEIEIEGLASFRQYAFSFVEKTPGLAINKNREMCMIERSFCKWSDLPGYSFKLEKAHFDVLHGDNFVRRTRPLDGYFVKFMRQERDDMFVGFLYREARGSQFKLGAIGNVEIEICNCTPDGFPTLSITKDGDGLLLNHNENGVLNSMDDPNASDIISFSTSIKLRK